MGMKLVNLQVELLGNQDILINGRPWQAEQAWTDTNEALFDKLHIEQQWAILCAISRMRNQLVERYNYKRNMLAGLPATDAERMKGIKSGRGGLPEYNIPPLPPNAGFEVQA